jgi:hypothetical protein
VHPDARFTLLLLAIALAAFPAWLAGGIISGNLTTRSWKRTQGVVVNLAADDHVEVEFGGEPDAVRVEVPIEHKIGLSFLKKVPVYVDPANPQRMRMGGLFQMWLWPTGLAFAAAVLLSVAGVTATIGRGHSLEPGEGTGRWMFSPPPPALQTNIRVYRPASEWKAPLFWSLLGVAALACAVFIRSGGQIQRMCLGSIGIFFMLLMWALALDNKTTEISADQNEVLKTTAFGWCSFRWEQVGSVEKEQTIFDERRLRYRRRTSILQREVTRIVFADLGGRKLVSMSVVMEPEKAMQQLLELCAKRTGQRMEFRKIYEPNL